MPFISRRMANFVARNVGAVSGKHCWKMPKSFLIKKGKEYGSLPSNSCLQKNSTVTEGEFCFHFFKKFIIRLNLFWGSRSCRSFIFFQFLTASFLRPGLADREICWLYSCFSNTCWFFALAYLFRDREWVGKIISFAKPATKQAETPWNF